jgi:thioredoxin reductase
MIEVAVIGAGTAGLAAARHLINAGLRPTIFEAAKTTGGAWTSSSSSTLSKGSTNDDSQSINHPARKMWNGMHTNLSKYTCTFSDWPWPEEASTFPSVEEMNRYLQSYSDCFIDLNNCIFQFQCEVTNVEQLDVELDGLSLKMDQPGYKVEWLDLTTQVRTNKDFGGVVVASGFFNKPKLPSFLENYSRDKEQKIPEIIHSMDYISRESFKNKNIAVIGASFSALEIAADLSKTASRIVNVVPSVPWVLPRWIPKVESQVENSQITILPVDLALYQRTQTFPQKEVVQLDPDSCRKRHVFMRTIAGHKQQHSPLGEPSNMSEPPYVAISDEYLDLVRERRIEVVQGRLKGINNDGSLCIGDLQAIEGIDTVICCTGYTPHLHKFLSQNILEKLDYNKEDTFSPLTLAWDVLHPSLPGLSFCGMVSLLFVYFYLSISTPHTNNKIFLKVSRSLHGHNGSTS